MTELLTCLPLALLPCVVGMVAAVWTAKRGQS